MVKLNSKTTEQPAETVADPLTAMLRQGAKELIAQAVEAELLSMLEQHQGLRMLDGRQAVVRNGYLPERTVQTGLGDVKVKVPKVRDRSGSGMRFNSTLLPPYLKRAKSIEELLPWLYLKGLSTGDYQEALWSLLGDQAKGLSANTISRLKQSWSDEHRQWSQRDLSQSRYVYWWADGVYSNVRMDDRLCLLVIIGVTEQGKKELVAVEDGFRESESSWYELMSGLKARGLQAGPKLAIGDGALGFWKAISKCFPESRHQRCWVHKMANVLNVIPKSVQPKMKAALQDIWMAETRQDALYAYQRALVRFKGKYPGAMERLRRDKEELLAFYDFPAEHWLHIRTTNPIESAFATVRLRTKRARNCGSRETTLAMVYKLLETAQRRWKRIRGFNLLTLVVNNVQFKDGEQVMEQSDRNAA
jgi:transposase-like protein